MNTNLLESITVRILNKLYALLKWRTQIVLIGICTQKNKPTMHGLVCFLSS